MSEFFKDGGSLLLGCVCGKRERDGSRRRRVPVSCWTWAEIELNSDVLVIL